MIESEKNVLVVIVIDDKRMAGIWFRSRFAADFERKAAKSRFRGGAISFPKVVSKFAKLAHLSSLSFLRSSILLSSLFQLHLPSKHVPGMFVSFIGK